MDSVVTKLEVLAIIPARGGSKGLVRKNISLLGGHPLIAYSVSAALQSETVTRVIVSTDDKEIAQIAIQYGAEVPFLRPAELAQDKTPDLPVFQHALEWLRQEEDYKPDLVVQLRPTTPIRPPDCIDRAVNLLIDQPQADSVRAVVPSGQNPYKMWRIEEDQMIPLLQGEFKEPYNMPRQKLPPTYWQTGHIDVIRPVVLLEQNSMSGKMIQPLVLDPGYSIDIDTKSDLVRGERMLQELSLPFVRPGRAARRLPDFVELVVFDFDGVFTDNRVWVTAEGVESVAAHRGDGWGLARLRETGIEVSVLSTETNPVVAARCKKLGIPVIQGVAQKGKALEAMLKQGGHDPASTIFVGNDVNDLPCFDLVACAVVVADAHPDVIVHADMVLQKNGGYGAVREICDILISQKRGKVLYGKRN
jgi:YrbI family 3-deoxy-D-manno-octulosonate 8-phosphate phosphatase